MIDVYKSGRRGKTTPEVTQMRGEIHRAIKNNPNLESVLNEIGTATNEEELEKLHSAIMNAAKSTKSEGMTSNKADIDNEPDVKGNKDFSPLTSEPIINRPYTQPNIKLENPDEVIPEPNFVSAPVDDFNPDVIIEGQPVPKPPSATELKNRTGRTGKSSERKPPREDRGTIENPYLIGESKKDQKLAAEQLADMAIGAYELLHDLAKKFLTVDENKLMKKAINGKFDMEVLNLELPVTEDGSTTITVKEYLDSFNQQVQDIYTVENSFKEKIRPVLIRIFMKHGWGMTDEQYALYLIVEDITPKIGALFTLKITTNQILNNSYEMLKLSKTPQQTVYSPPTVNPQAPPPKPNKEESGVINAEVITENDFKEPEENQ